MRKRRKRQNRKGQLPSNTVSSALLRKERLQTTCQQQKKNTKNPKTTTCHTQQKTPKTTRPQPTPTPRPKPHTHRPRQYENGAYKHDFTPKKETFPFLPILQSPHAPLQTQAREQLREKRKGGGKENPMPINLTSQRTRNRQKNLKQATENLTGKKNNAPIKMLPTARVPQQLTKNTMKPSTSKKRGKGH